MNRIALTILILLFANDWCEAQTFPQWFVADNDQYGIFQAWKFLSARDAALYLGVDWKALGGVLRDENGVALPLTPILLAFNGGIRANSANVMTDKDGYFIVYSPYSIDISGDDRSLDLSFKVYACPGYPYSFQGYAYAEAKGDVKICNPKLLYKTEDRAFYELSVQSKNSFDEDGFTKFREKLREEGSKKGSVPWRDSPRSREGGTERRERTTYEIQVVSVEGKPIPKSIVKYIAYDGYDGNSQVVETDGSGLCQVEEFILPRQPRNYYSEIVRRLTIDAPDYGVGPVTCNLRKGKVNIIKLETPGAVSGRIADHNGNPTYTSLKVQYKKPNGCAFETDVPINPDGTFTFTRIMPKEPFKLVGMITSLQVAPLAPVETDYFILEPGEHKTDVQMIVPLAAALRGLVIDQDGAPVKDIGEFILVHERSDRSEDRGGLIDGDLISGGEKFGYNPIGQTPFRISIKANGFEEYLSDVIQLEPGELRFIRIVLRSKGK